MFKGQKGKLLIFIGLGMAFIGVAWFTLSVAGILTGAMMMLGYFLGVGLAISGLIVSAVYFFRYRRIQQLLQGNDVLVKWADGENQIIIAPTCAYAYGELYLWGVLGTRLEGVQIEHQTFLGSARPYLRITIGEASNQRSPVTGSRLWRTRELSIRIPEGQELTAQTVVEQLKSRLSP